MNLPRNSRSFSSCWIAPFIFLSSAAASLGTDDWLSRMGRMSASASAFSGVVFSSRAWMCPPLPLANAPYCTGEQAGLAGGRKVARAGFGSAAPLALLPFLKTPFHLGEVGIRVTIPADRILPAGSRDSQPDPGGDCRG